jgi:hypothetical protein
MPKVFRQMKGLIMPATVLDALEEVLLRQKLLCLD